MAFTIERVPNQAGKPAVLLRQAWREGSRIRKKAIADLSMLPDHVVEGFRTVLKGGVAVGDVGVLMTVERWIERDLARRHLEDATLILYDVSSSFIEGRMCPLAAFGYNRDGKKNKQQLVFGLL